MKLLWTFLLFAALLMSGHAVVAQPAPEKLSHRVPEETWKAEVKGFDNAPSFKLEDARGKVILLEVWAYYFRPGREGLEELRRIREEFAGENLEVVGISLYYSFDDDRQGAKDFVRESDFKFKMGWINNEIGGLLMSDSAATPNFMLISSDGILVERILGFNPEKTPALLREAIKPLLRKKSTATINPDRLRSRKREHRERKI